MSEWQPIETAPKDGRHILVYPGTYNGVTASPARWERDDGVKAPRPYWLRLDAWSVIKSRCLTPTHWMPMPEPPT
jgi:hypothetical protein